MNWLKIFTTRGFSDTIFVLIQLWGEFFFVDEQITECIFVVSSKRSQFFLHNSRRSNRKKWTVHSMMLCHRHCNTTTRVISFPLKIVARLYVLSCFAHIIIIIINIITTTTTSKTTATTALLLRLKPLYENYSRAPNYFSMQIGFFCLAFSLLLHSSFIYTQSDTFMMNS